MKSILTTLIFFGVSLTVRAQNIGIGETAPTAMKLQVKSADSAVLLIQNSTPTGSNVKTGLFFKTGTNYSGSIGTVGSGATFRMGMFTYGGAVPSALLERVSILDGGNVGIGTTNPSAKLEINGTLKITDGTQGAGKVLTSDAAGLVSWVAPAGGGGLPSGVSGNTLRHNGTSFIATSNLYNDGTNIGIGTTAPGAMMEIKAAAASQADIELNASLGNNALLKLNKNGASNVSAVRFKNSGTVTWDLGTFGDDNFKIKYTPTNASVIDIDDATRHIGIATNDYSEQINVGGNVGAAGAFISKNSNAGFQFEDRTANAYGGWNWYADGGKANLYRYGSGGNLLTVDGAGKMGIGVVSPTSPLSFPNTIGKKISLYPGGTGDAGFGVFGNELRINSDNINADVTFGYDNFTNGFSEKMRVKGNGNVGIGTNNPSNKLDVNGRMRLRNEGGGNTAGMWVDGTATAQRGFIGAYDDNYMGFYGSANGWGLLYNETSGQVNIGTATPATGYLLNVNGKIISEEVRVQLKAAWPDYVFNDGYKKLTIPQLESYLKENKHLPNLPSAKEIEDNGQHLGEIQRKMMEKVEEMSLYIIELKKEIDELKIKVYKNNKHGNNR